VPLFGAVPTKTSFMVRSFVVAAKSTEVAGATSKILCSPPHGVLPDLVAVVIEYKRWILGCREPGVAREFCLQLARTPPGITESNQTFQRAALACDIAKNIDACSHRHAPVDVEGLGAVIFSAVDDEASLGLDGTTAVHRHIFGRRTFILAKRVQERRKRSTADRSIDHDTESPLLIVSHHEDDRMIESRISHGG